MENGGTYFKADGCNSTMFKAIPQTDSTCAAASAGNPTYLSLACTQEGHSYVKRTCGLSFASYVLGKFYSDSACTSSVAEQQALPLNNCVANTEYIDQTSSWGPQEYSKVTTAGGNATVNYYSTADCT